MTEEEQVLNVRGEEITENSEDHRKIKAEHCNGVPHADDGENGNVGDAVADSGESDLVIGNGAASKEEHKVSCEDVAESQVTVSEWEMVNNEESASSAASNGSAEETLETANTDVVLPASESERAEGQNGAGSVVVLGDNADVTDLAGESETRDYLTEGVADHDRESKNVVVVEECKSEAGAEVAGDEKDAVAVTVVAEEGVADADKSDSEFEVVAVQNGVDRADEDEVPVVMEGVAATTDEKDCENDEGDVSVDTKLGECTEKNEVAVDADTDSDAVSAVSDVRKGESKDAQNVLEKEVVESVSDANMEKSIDGVQNGLLSESAEENKVHVEGEPGILEVSEEEVIPVVSEDVIKSKVEPSVDASETENNSVDVEGELSNEAVESAAEPSNNAVQSEAELCVDESEAENNAEESGAEPSNNADESGAEPSNNADESGAEPSNNAEESGAEPSNNAEESGAEPSNNALQSESERSVDVSEIENNAGESAAEPSNNALQSEGERCVDVSEMKNSREESEAEPSNNAVQNDGEVSVDVSEMENNPVDGEAKPLNNAVQSEGELSVDISDVKPNAVDNEAEQSDNAVEGGGKASVDVSKAKNIAVDGEHEPSDIAVESHGGPSVDVSEVKNSGMDGEAETSDKAVPREDEPCVDVSEMKNNTEESKAEPSNDAVQIEAEPCVEVSDMKTNVVEGEAEPSVGESSNHGDEDSEPAQEGSSADTLDGKNMGTEVVRRPLYYLIRHPRYDDDENFKEQIKNASHLVDEKTKIRDEIRAESQTLKAICRECSQDVRSAVSAERAARDLLRSKRQEMDAVQSTLNRLNNAISVGDINSKIKNIEFMIQHETMLLHEEKELLRQIKQLKQNREELASNMGKQDQSQQSLDDKGSIEENFKLLKKEVEVLRNNVLKTEAATKAARKKYDDESNKLNEVLSRFKAADDIRQEAYAKLQALKKQFYEKSKCFWEYKNAATKAQELAAEGKKEELLCFCDKQVERTMEMWNKNDEFRRDYVRCNTRSTLRRLQTLDGRALGPDEEPPVIPNALTERASKNNSLAPQPTLEKETKSMPTESVKIKDEPAPRVVVQRTEASQTTKSNNIKPAKPVVGVSRWGDESDEDTREEPVRTKEEEEQILKAEKAKKEEEAAKLKEKRRLEEIEKAKEAVERKKRIAEKAQQRAAIKAQKEAEQKEKEREKRARRKERRKTAPTDTAENTEQEPAPSSEPLTRNAEECDQIEKPTEVTKKQQKPSQFTRQTKAKSLPMSIRNRAKRRIQPWMWVLIGVLALVALFYLGNNSTLRSSMQGFGF